MSASPDTLLRLVRQTPEMPVKTPRVLGIDDWAKRKGHTYGTILVDLETHEVVDLLDSRSADAVIQWLEQHPGVDIIARDRGSDYIEGATKGAPSAIQIADRFHLFQNIVEVLKRFFEKQPGKLRQATRAVSREKQKLVDDQMAEEVTANYENEPTERELRFEEVKRLQAEGWKQRVVARHLQMSRRTVSKYFELEALPSGPPGRSPPRLSHRI